MTSIKRFLNDESGATAIEYGLIAAGLAVAIATMMSTISGGLTGLATDIKGRLAVVGG